MKEPNDGVMLFRGGGYAPNENNYGFAKIIPAHETGSIHNFNPCDETDPYFWLPDPNRRYRIYFGVYRECRQIAIALRRPPQYSTQDQWDRRCVASGFFDELWPMFLVYCEMLQ